MKSFWTAVLAISIIANFVMSTENVSATTRDYLNEYKGIYTGVSTKKDVIQKFGKPIRIEKAGKGQNYRYQKVKVNFPAITDKVNTIIIDHDYSYIDPNGFKLGDSIQKVRRKIRGESRKSTITDQQEGIVYWHDGKVIKRIILTRSLLVSQYRPSPEIHKIVGKDGKVLYTNR